MSPARLVLALLVPALVFLAPTSGCSRAPIPQPDQAPARVSAAAPAETKEDYKLVGVVRGVDPKTGIVTIRHEAIPGFMAAMTMPFTLKDKALFEDLRPGDEVEGKLRVERAGGEVKDYELLDLVVSRPAPPPSLTLGLSPDGGARLSPTPKVLAPGESVPDFSMTTQEGKTLRLSDLRGKVVALTFIYTRCPLPEFCPLMDRKFAEMASRIAAVPGRAGRVRLVSLSFDPEHDTPTVLREHARTRGAGPPLWTFAVAPHAELARIAPALGLTYGPRPGEIAHTLSTAVIGPDGRLVRLEAGTSGKTWTPADLLKTIYSQIPGPKG